MPKQEKRRTRTADYKSGRVNLKAAAAKDGKKTKKLIAKEVRYEQQELIDGDMDAHRHNLIIMKSKNDEGLLGRSSDLLERECQRSVAVKAVEDNIHSIINNFLL
jgi:hypothetical protein